MEIGVDLPEECYSKLKCHTVIQLFISNDHVHRPQFEQVTNCENYNSFNDLSRVTALILKFAHLIFQKIGCTNELINSNTLDDARFYWLMESQPLLPQDRRFLSWKHQFDLYLDSSHIWRCVGRMSNSDLPVSPQNPILLDKQHHIARIIVRNAYECVLHVSVEETLTEV